MLAGAIKNVITTAQRGVMVMKFRKALFLSSIAAAAVTTVPAYSQTKGQAEQSFFSTLLSAGVPPLAQLAMRGLSFFAEKVLGIDNLPKPPKQAAPSPSGSVVPRAGLAYTVYRVNSAKQVTIAGSEDLYRPGEGIAIAITNNLPGILDVDNIDAAGKREPLESVTLTSIRQILLPAQTQGYYVVNADSSGDERLELRFFPCKPVMTESMAVREDKAVAELAQQTALKADVMNALGPCPTKAQRNAVKSVSTESMGVISNTQVASATRTLAASAKNPIATPVFVTVRVGRVQ